MNAVIMQEEAMNETELGGIYGRVCKEGKQGRKVIIFQCQKKNL